MNLLFSLNIHGYKIIAVVWNLILILIPCWVVFFLAESVGKRRWGHFKAPEKAAFALFFLFWLFFFPNTAYQFMIPRHLADYCPHFDQNRVCDTGSWLVVFFFIYALAGLPAFYYALDRMGRLVATVFSAKVSKAFLFLMPPLTALGVMLGLFERANSWDVVSHPLSLIQTAWGYFTTADTLLFFGVFTASLYLIYYGFRFLIGHLARPS